VVEEKHRVATEPSRTEPVKVTEDVLPAHVSTEEVQQAPAVTKTNEALPSISQATNMISAPTSTTSNSSTEPVSGTTTSEPSVMNNAASVGLVTTQEQTALRNALAALAQVVQSQKTTSPQVNTALNLLTQALQPQDNASNTSQITSARAAGAAAAQQNIGSSTLFSSASVPTEMPKLAQPATSSTSSVKPDFKG